jgi:hypothetical protein
MEMLKKEKENWKHKVVVSRPHVLVNTRIAESHVVAKYKDIREDPVQKKGLVLSNKKVKQLKARGIQAHKEAPIMPVNQHAAQHWISNEYD